MRKDRSESERWKGKRERERYKTGIDIYYDKTSVLWSLSEEPPV